MLRNSSVEFDVNVRKYYLCQSGDLKYEHLCVAENSFHTYPQAVKRKCLSLLNVQDRSYVQYTSTRVLKDFKCLYIIYILMFPIFVVKMVSCESKKKKKKNLYWEILFTIFTTASARQLFSIHHFVHCGCCVLTKLLTALLLLK